MPLVAILALLLGVGQVRAGDFRTPDPDKIQAFESDPLFPYSTGDFPVVISKERFLQFLRKGRRIAETERKEWLGKQVTFPKVTSALARAQLETIARLGSAQEAFVCAGACASEDHIWFWRLWNDHLLSVSDDSGQVWLTLEEGPSEAPNLFPAESNGLLSLGDAKVSEVQIAPPRDGVIEGETKSRDDYLRSRVLSFFKARSASWGGKDGPSEFTLDGKIFSISPHRYRGAALLSDNRLVFWQLWNLATLQVANKDGEKMFLILNAR